MNGNRNSYSYNIPSNMFASIALGYLKEIFKIVYGDFLLASLTESLRLDIIQGIEQAGIVYNPTFGTVYAFETDGKDHIELQRADSTLPSVLLMRYLGYKGNSRIFESSRKSLLANSNDSFRILEKGLLSTSKKEVKSILEVLASGT